MLQVCHQILLAGKLALRPGSKSDLCRRPLASLACYLGDLPHQDCGCQRADHGGWQTLGTQGVADCRLGNRVMSLPTIETGDSLSVLYHEHMPTQVVPRTNQLTQYSPHSLIRAPSTAVRHWSILPTTPKPPHHQCHLPTAWYTNCVTHSSVYIGTATFTPHLRLTLPRSTLHACQLPTPSGCTCQGAAGAMHR